MLSRTLLLLGIAYLATTNSKQLVLNSTPVFINASAEIEIDTLLAPMGANSRRVMQALGNEWSSEQSAQQVVTAK